MERSHRKTTARFTNRLRTDQLTPPKKATLSHGMHIKKEHRRADNKKVKEKEEMINNGNKENNRISRKIQNKTKTRMQ